MLPTLPRLDASPEPFRAYANPYKAKKQWPPDFTQLSQKHQFSLERRYRRRSKLKWARPKWTKFVKLATWSSIAFVGVYGVLFMKTSEHGSPFDFIRDWYSSFGQDIFDNSPQSPVERARERKEQKSP